MANARDEVLRRRRVSYEQLESLWEFLNSHRDIAIGYNKSSQARDYSKRMWVSVTDNLNSLGEGATKDWKGWSTYWVDYKAKLKRRVAALRASQSRTGGGPADVIPLNDMEKKFMYLLGEGFGSGLPNTQVDPFPNLTPPVPVGPEAGQSQSSHEGSVQDTITEETPPLVPQEEWPFVQEEEPPARHVHQTPDEPQRPRNAPRRRRIRRPTALSQQMAREALVNISRERLLAEQNNHRSLSQIAEGLQNQNILLQDMLTTLNRIAAVIDRSVGLGRPETRDEGVSDS